MSGVEIVQVIAYVAVAVFLVAMARRAIRYMRTPIHLRWELYPVPHESGKDGSYLEELDWWEKPPRHSSMIGELKVMVPEILFLVGLWEHNRKLWFASFPFHAGIYLTILFLALLLGGGVTQAAGASVSADSNAALHYVTIVVGAVGIISVGVGALALLVMRLADTGLRLYAVPADYFNLGFILAMAVIALISWLAVDQSFTEARGYAEGLVSFGQPADTSGLIVTQSLLLSLFLVYLPFTHMTHFVGKFFTYHMVRWDDAPNLRGSKYERLIAGLLQRPVAWSAPHVQQGRSWAEVAKTVPEVEE